jgi:hypothetical protein
MLAAALVSSHWSTTHLVTGEVILNPSRPLGIRLGQTHDSASGSEQLLNVVLLMHEAAQAGYRLVLELYLMRYCTYMAN